MRASFAGFGRCEAPSPSLRAIPANAALAAREPGQRILAAATSDIRVLAALTPFRVETDPSESACAATGSDADLRGPVPALDSVGHGEATQEEGPVPALASEGCGDGRG